MHPTGFQGETRAERIAEFLVANPGRHVVGLPEGTMLQVEKERIALHGDGAARIFEAGREPRDVVAGEPLDFLAET
jgi:dipeptidase E